MRIQCTKELLKLMKREPVDLPSIEKRSQAAGKKKDLPTGVQGGPFSFSGKQDGMSEEEQEELLFTWNAVILRLGRTRFLIMQNSLTRCVIIFLRPMAKDFAALNERMRDAVLELFTAMEIPENQIRMYLLKAGECVFTKSGSRKELGRVLQVCKDMEFSYDPFIDIRPDVLIQTEAGIGWSESRLMYDEEKHALDAIQCTRKMVAKYCGR